VNHVKGYEMDAKINIAVLGSCATRDNFNSKFNDNYKDFYQCVLTQNQTSIISLMSKEMSFIEEDIGELDDYTKWNVRTDFTKDFLSILKEKTPDYLIIDFFADIHFGCIRIDNNKYITNNRWMLWKTPYFKRLKETENFRTLNIQDNTDQYIELWKGSIDKLANFIAEEVPGCKVIIHKARNVRNMLTNDCGKIVDLSTSGKVKKENVERLNALWEQLDDYAVTTYNWGFIEMPESSTFEGHPWGPFYVHYTMDYYQQFLNQLHGIVIQNIVNQTDNKLLRDIVNDWAKKHSRITLGNLEQYRQLAQEKLSLENQLMEEKRKNDRYKSEIEKLKSQANIKGVLKRSVRRIPILTKIYRVINKALS
jgi:hypothetical protein